MDTVNVDVAALAAEADVRAAAGQTPMYVAVDGTLAGLVAVADTVKDTSAEAVAQLEALGLEVWMLTGDNAATAAAIASSVGIDHVVADVLPAEKAAHVQRLQDAGPRCRFRRRRHQRRAGFGDRRPRHRHRHRHRRGHRRLRHHPGRRRPARHHRRHRAVAPHGAHHQAGTRLGVLVQHLADPGRRRRPVLVGPAAARPGARLRRDGDELGLRGLERPTAAPVRATRDRGRDPAAEAVGPRRRLRLPRHRRRVALTLGTVFTWASRTETASHGMNGLLAWTEGMGMPMRPAMSVMETTDTPPISAHDAGLRVTLTPAGDLTPGVRRSCGSRSATRMGTRSPTWSAPTRCGPTSS